MAADPPVSPGVALLRALCTGRTVSPARCYALAASWDCHPDAERRRAALEWERLGDLLVRGRDVR